ncbi:MAG TPA: cytochrome c [Azospirillum sp.]|nr:cytochrome c [Azospirillum sp.]
MIRRLFVTGLLVAAGAGALAATDGPGSPASGRRLAVELCRECHVVSPDQDRSGKEPGPDLTQRVRNPAITELALRSYLQTSHPVMPNIMLSQEQADDLIAYLLTFKRGPR